MENLLDHKSVKRQQLTKANVSVLSIFCATISLFVGWHLVPLLINSIISYKIVISPDQAPELYPNWVRPPIPIYFNITLFNVTNPNEVKSGDKPSFNEVGPYIFEETRTKFNITLDDASDTARYFAKTHYEFRPDLSANLSLDDIVTIINIPFAAATIKIEREMPWPLKHVAHLILADYEEPLFVQKTVNEILFQGWRVPFLEKIEQELGLTFVPNNTFSIFGLLNDTVDGPFVIDRGMHGNKQDMGKILQYKNKPFMEVWGKSDSPCNQIKGTDGTIFPPFVTKQSILQVFDPDSCGSLYLKYVNETEVSGIFGYRFSVPLKALDDPWNSEETRCFCVNGKDECLGRGVLDVAPCKDGAPIGLSLPHFLHADEQHLETIKEGVKPEKAKHEIFIDVEPTTGIVLQGSKRFQINLILKPVKNIPSLSEVQSMLFPCVWVDEGARLEGPYADLLRSTILAINLFEMGTKVVSVFIAIAVPIFLRRRCVKFSKQEHQETYIKSKEMTMRHKLVPEKMCLKCSDLNEFTDKLCPCNRR